MAEFNQGDLRQRNPAYHRINVAVAKAKKQARHTGEWHHYKTLRQQMLHMPPHLPHDTQYRRLVYIRYADDWLIGINGSKEDARHIKAWAEGFLRDTLQLE